MTQIFLNSTGGVLASFPDPGNWNNSSNTIECIGSGSGGAMPTSLAVVQDVPGPPPVQGQGGGGGGGGGAYAKGTNIPVAAWPVSYLVYSGSSSGAVFTAWDCTLVGGVDGKVRAAIAGLPSGTAGAPGGGSFFPTGFAGGTGGAASSTSGSPGAGGGGAAGPQGSGGAGGLASTVASAGGAANNGTVPGGAVGVIGNSGTQFDATHGCGSGGGGSPTGAGSVAGRGGSYGGGGGGGILANPASPGVGGDGLIVLTYVPAVAPPAGGRRAIIIM